MFPFFPIQTERHDSGRENQGLKFVAPKMGRIYSKIIAPIQPIRRQCVRVDKEMLVEGWIDIYFFQKCLCTRWIRFHSQGIDGSLCVMWIFHSAWFYYFIQDINNIINILYLCLFIILFTVSEKVLGFNPYLLFVSILILFC